MRAIKNACVYLITKTDSIAVFSAEHNGVEIKQKGKQTKMWIEAEIKQMLSIHRIVI